MSGNTASTGFVGCDPTNVRTLANRMHDLASCLATEGPKIRQLMLAWDDETSWTQLGAVQGRFTEQATAMVKRADLAADLAKQIVPGISGTITDSLGTPLCLTSSMVTMPFDTSDATYVNEAAQDVAAFKKAQDSGGGQKNLDKINQIAQDLTDHQGDTQYLTAFYNGGGAELVYHLPAVLRSWDEDKYLGKDMWLTPTGRRS